MLGYNTPMGKNHTTTSFGARLAELGRARGLDTGQVAYRAGLSYNYVYSLIQGRRANPSYAALRRLARAVGVEPDELVRGTGLALPARDPAVEELAGRLQDLPRQPRQQVLDVLVGLLDLIESQLASYSAAMRSLLAIQDELTVEDEEALLALVAEKLQQAAPGPADGGAQPAGKRN